MSAGFERQPPPSAGDGEAEFRTCADHVMFCQHVRACWPFWRFLRVGSSIALLEATLAIAIRIWVECH